MRSEFTNGSGKSLHYHLGQAILRNARHKSILRLGVEDAKPSLLKHMEQEKQNEIIHALQEFEKDIQSFGLYTRTLTAIVQIAE